MKKDYFHIFMQYIYTHVYIHVDINIHTYMCVTECIHA